MQDEIKQKLITGLHENVVIVKFTKVDGSLREMNCTTSETMIPVENLTKNSSKKKNEDVAVVWDLDKSAWRSFRFDTVDFFEYSGVTYDKTTEFFKGRAM